MIKLSRALLLVILLALAGEAHAQNWPTRPIKLIVPTGAGHAVDVMARILSTGVSQTIGQTVFVENMPGASGFLGAQATARSETGRLHVPIRAGIAVVIQHVSGQVAAL
jgi:tripartite-type tricarboxylate transporter receptor subunit TctC